MDELRNAEEPRGPREACGVFAIAARDFAVAKAAFFGLDALQHRGQESAGIAVMGAGQLRAHRGMGLVTQVFTERDLTPLTGEMALGHVRYSTTGRSDLAHAQPHTLDTDLGPLALAHNGNLTNARALRQALADRPLKTDSDSELLLHLLASGGDITSRLLDLMARAKGAYSLAILTPTAIYALRDPRGFRPLHLGLLDTASGLAPVVASESCAFGPIGARPLREVLPGELVRLTPGALPVSLAHTPQPRAFCAFEHVYFARPDSLLDGALVHATRQRLGELLAHEAPASADLVIGVPDSALPAALGYARASGIPYGEGLIKNRYIGRTFIQPTPELRRAGVRLKYNPLSENLRGRRIVVVDDSLVRGTTALPLVALLRDAGATEVHLRIASPPVRHPCYMGVDMPRREDLLTHRVPASDADLARHLGADSCAFLSEASLALATHPDGHCRACFSGHYPLTPPEHTP